MSSVLYVLFHRQDDERAECELVHTLKGHVTSVGALSFHPAGLFLASGCSKGWLNVWSLQVSARSSNTKLSELWVFENNST